MQPLTEGIYCAINMDQFDELNKILSSLFGEFIKTGDIEPKHLVYRKGILGPIVLATDRNKKEHYLPKYFEKQVSFSTFVEMAKMTYGNFKKVN